MFVFYKQTACHSKQNWRWQSPEQNLTGDPKRAGSVLSLLLLIPAALKRQAPRSCWVGEGFPWAFCQVRVDVVPWVISRGSRSAWLTAQFPEEQNYRVAAGPGKWKGRLHYSACSWGERRSQGGASFSGFLFFMKSFPDFQTQSNPT